LFGLPTQHRQLSVPEMGAEQHHLQQGNLKADFSDAVLAEFAARRAIASARRTGCK